jgi:hypothetical protein
VRHVGIIGVIVKLRMLVEVSRPCVDVVQGAVDVPIRAIAAVESVDIEVVDDPREAGTLAKGAVELKSPGAASAWRGVERDGLAVAKPHREVSNCRFLVLQSGRKIPALRDEHVSLFGQVARGGEGPLLWRFSGGLVHGRMQSGAIAVLWRQ